MKVLLDSCIWGGAKKVLEADGHDPIWIGEVEDPGDEAVIQRAYKEKRVLVTLDKDFGELAVFKEMPHWGIIRIVNYPAREQGIICTKVLQKYEKDLKEGAVITVEKTRIRIRTNH